MTLHRPATVDDRQALGAVVRTLVDISDRLDIVFPMLHPAPPAIWSAPFLFDAALRAPHPFDRSVGYVEFMRLVRWARCVITDPGGVQEETTYLDIPCLTLRDTTERPITVTEGTNRLVRIDGIAAAVASVLAGNWPPRAAAGARMVAPPGAS